MVIRLLVPSAIAITLLVAAIRPMPAVAQAPATPDISRFVGTWVGDRKANDKPWQAGMIPTEFGLKISIVSDALVVAQLYKRPPVALADPWIPGDTSSYQLGGSLLSTSFNGVPARSTLVKDGDSLVLTTLRIPARTGGAGAGPLPPPPGSVLRAQRMSVDGDRLKVEWNAAEFVATLFFDREKPHSGPYSGGQPSK